MTSFEKMVLANAFVSKLIKLDEFQHENATHGALEYACGVVDRLRKTATSFYAGFEGTNASKLLDEAFDGPSERAKAERVCDLPITVNLLGVRIRSADKKKLGTIIDVDLLHRDPYFIVQWDDGSEDGFFGNNACRCEIICEGKK